MKTTYYLWVNCGDYSAVHGQYASHAEAQAKGEWLHERYKPTSIVDCQVTTYPPKNPKPWPIYDMPDDDNNPLRKEHSLSA